MITAISIMCGCWLLAAVGLLSIICWAKRNAEPSSASIFHPKVRRVECAWCGHIMAPGAEPISHGICPDCFAGEINSDPKFRAFEGITVRDR